MNKRGEGNYTAEGINAIAAALHVSASLTSINLKQNKLGDEGWGAILAGACANKDSKIASINMSSEGISLAGAKLIGEALRTSVSTSLTQVLAFFLTHTPLPLPENLITNRFFCAAESGEKQAMWPGQQRPRNPHR